MIRTASSVKRLQTSRVQAGFRCSLHSLQLQRVRVVKFVRTFAAQPGFLGQVSRTRLMTTPPFSSSHPESEKLTEPQKTLFCIYRILTPPTIRTSSHTTPRRLTRHSPSTGILDRTNHPSAVGIKYQTSFDPQSLATPPLLQQPPSTRRQEYQHFEPALLAR